MKKLLIILSFLLLIFAAQVKIYGQLRQDITIYREDAKTVLFTVSGNQTARVLTFAVKADFPTTDNILILKTSTAGKITTTRDSVRNRTAINVILIPNDTRDLDAATYYYDLESASATDTNDVVTLARGSFVVQSDVYNRLSGTDLADDGLRYVPVLTSQFNENDFIQRKGNSFVGVQLDTSTQVRWRDTTNTIPTKAFLSLNHYTKSAADLLLGVKLNLADSTNKWTSKYYLAQNYRTAIAEDALNGAKLDTSAFSTRFNSLLATKTLDNISAGSTNVHLTTTLKTNYDAAYTALHSHANKSKLDSLSVSAALLNGITASFTSTLKTNYDAAYSHVSNTSNPHSVTKTQVGLGSVENTALSTWAGTSNIVTTGIFNRTAGIILQATTGDNIGFGSVTTPQHKITIGASSAGNLNAFNFVNTDINRSRATVTQARDTSSYSGYFTATGKPQIFIKGIAGEAIFNIDSTATVGIGTAAPDDGSKLHVYNSSALGRIKVDGRGTGYTQADILLQSNANARGAGIYLYNTVNDVNWYFGNPYSSVSPNSDRFIISRKAGTTFDVSTADYADASILLHISNTGNATFAGNIAGSNAGGTTISSSASFLALTANTYLSMSSTGTNDMYLNVGGDLKFRDANNSNATRFTMAMATGNATFTGSALLPNGTAAAPALAFSTEPTTGFYRDAPNVIRVSLSGVRYQQFGTNGLSLLDNSQGIVWGAASDVYLVRDAANTLALRNSTNAQTFNIYNTYTDPSNYERLKVYWTSNYAFLEVGNAGTGTLRSLIIDASSLIFRNGGTNRWQMVSGNFLPDVTNTYDLGTSAKNVRTGYFGTSINLASTGYFYMAGDATTDGSWRMSATASGSCVIEARISGTWTAKQTLTF
jgi:hypothetical protein